MSSIKKKTIPKTLKRLVWNKYIGEEIGKAKCLCCNLTDITQMSFHCGHITAEANGGQLVVDNLRPICQSCNSSMGVINMSDFAAACKIPEVKTVDEPVSKDSIKKLEEEAWRLSHYETSCQQAGCSDANFTGKSSYHKRELIKKAREYYDQQIRFKYQNILYHNPNLTQREFNAMYSNFLVKKRNLVKCIKL